MPPPRPPDFETPDIERMVESVIGKYSLRWMIMVAVIAFAFGGWMTKLSLDISSALSRPDMSANHEWRLDSAEQRISKLEQRP